MNRLLAIIVGLLILALLLVFSTTYTVPFHAVGIKRTFGKSSEADVQMTPGLKWKLPIVGDKRTHDTRIQILESPIEEISTSDGQQVAVKAFLMWKVDTSDAQGPLAFDRSYASIEDAQSGLRDPFVTAMAGALSRYRFDDLLGADSKLAAAEQAIMVGMADLRDKGIEPVRVGLSQVMLPAKTSSTVIQRMQATRTRLAESQRIVGQARANAISSRASKDAELIQRFADELAAEIRNRGSEKAATWMTEMAEEEELATFLAWLDTIQATMAAEGTVVMPTSMAPWHLLNLTTRRNSRGIPMPSESIDDPALAERLP